MQKQGPCGAGPGDPRGPTVATFKPGEKIVVVFDEFVDHPGHFRIAFDDDGQDIFVDPKGFDDVGGGPGVLLDGIPDTNGGLSMVEVTLPNIECDNCVLQVIQVMTDKEPFGDGNDMYYQCADIALMGEVASTTSGETGSTSDAGTSTTDTSAGSTSAAETTGTTDASAGETAGASEASTSEAPTTGGSTGAASGTSDGAATAGSGDDEGCGCRGDAGGGWLALGLLPLLLPRRRRALGPAR